MKVARKIAFVVKANKTRPRLAKAKDGSLTIRNQTAPSFGSPRNNLQKKPLSPKQSTTAELTAW
jgi:hypothetical protein